MPHAHEPAPADAGRERARRPPSRVGTGPRPDGVDVEGAGPAGPVGAVAQREVRARPAGVLSRTAVQRLQRLAGNRAVAHLVRPPGEPAVAAGAGPTTEGAAGPQTEAPTALAADRPGAAVDATPAQPVAPPAAGGPASGPSTSQNPADATESSAPEPAAGPTTTASAGAVQAGATAAPATAAPAAAAAPATAAPAAAAPAAAAAPVAAWTGAPPVLEHRAAPKPAVVPPPAEARSTVAPAGPAPTPAAAPEVAAPERPAPAAAPTVDTGGGGADDGGAPPVPAPGLGDDELAVLDESSSSGGPEAAEEGAAETAAAPGGSAETSAPVAAPEPTDVEQAATAGPAADLGSGGADTAGAGAVTEADAEVAAEPVAGEPPAADQAAAEEAAAEQTAAEQTAAEPEATQPAASDQADTGAAQEAIAAGAQAEVEEASSGGPEPAEAAGGGGGGAAVEEPAVAAPPDVSSAPPEQAMAVVGSLRPTQMAATLGGVEAAAGGAVAKEQARLAAAPPTHTPLAGATAEGAASDQVPATAAATTAQVRQVTPGAAHPTPAPTPLPAPPPPAAARVAAPALPLAPEGGLTQEGARDLAASIDRMPTRDPGAAVTPGPAPNLALAGEADPAQVRAQQAHLAEGAAHAHAEGTRDAAEPMGEDAVRPTVPVETIEADVGAGGGAAGGAGPATAGGAAGGGAAGTEAGDDAAVDAVVEEQQGPAVRAAATAGAAQMTTVKQQHAEQETARRDQATQEVAALEAEHAQAEQAQRASLKADVTNQRTQWKGEQATLVAGADAEARTVTAGATETVAAEQTKAQTDAAQAHAAGAQEAEEARQAGEREAAEKRAEAKKESGGGGFFGWVASKATALFDKVKAGISAAFEKARQAVRAAVEKAQQLATAIIEKARQAVVAAIKLAGSALTAIGDRLLAAFPALRERFRNAIRAAVQRAEAAVNRLAEGLKNGVKAALGLLGRALTALLSGLEAGLKAVVSAVAATVNGAINAARAALAAIGAFLAIAKDVAANPGAWLRNLGAAIVDGIRNHLWKALKTAVQTWFNNKVEQVLGLGRAVWNLLTKGGISIAKIGAMAWEGIKAAIPPALIGLLVEKLVSMIVPAAGAVLAIVQGLQAAWGTVSQILQAMDKFIAFLRAVKSGQGGPAFADVVAAAAITVVDFVSNWLLARLAKGASKVAGKIREIAKKIGAALKKVVKKIGGALKRLGRKIGDKLKGARDKFTAWRERRAQKKKAQTPADKQKKLEERLEKAVAAIQPQAERLLARGVTGLGLRARMLYWRLRYRLTSVELQQGGDTAEIWATINPRRKVRSTAVLTPAQIRTVVNQAVRDFLRDPAVRQRRRDLTAQVRENPNRMDVRGGPGMGAATQHLRNEENRVWPRTQQTGTHGTDQGAALETSERASPRWFSPGPTSAFVGGVGKYPEIARDLRATGISDAAMAGHLRTLIQTGVAPRELTGKQATLLGNVAWLMFGRESHRNRRNLAYGAMTVDLVASGNMSWHEAFAQYEPGGGQSRTGGRGAFPMSMRGAERAAAELNPQDPRIARPPAATEPSAETLATRRRNREELERRETEMCERWVTTRLQLQGGMVGLSAQALGDAVRRMVREFFVQG